MFTSGDAEEFSQRAADIVTSYDVGPYRNAPHLNEAAALEAPEELDVWDGLELGEDHSFNEIPYAEIVVTVSDPGYLEHMVAGMRWDTTMTGELATRSLRVSVHAPRSWVLLPVREDWHPLGAA
ncbi:hypothetical protein [Nonomuraea bangladeshensis]|uniref:hypothetical protein n=1 Tax=Nonomuraea bangladeshensis TaxID=404385 RepID=UPI003C2C9675